MDNGSDNKNGGAQGVQVIARAASILRVLKADNNGLSLGEIAKRTALPRATVQRIVNALLHERLVIAVSGQGGLRLGPEIQSLARSGSVNFAEMVRPALEHLAEETGETVDLTVLRDDHVIFVDQVVGTHKLRTVSAVGEVFTLTNTASGKAALALLDDETVMKLARKEFASGMVEPRPIETLMAEIEQVRSGHPAFDLDEHTAGVSAVSLALKDPLGDIYSISLPVPTQRFRSRKSELVAALMKTFEKARASVIG